MVLGTNVYAVVSMPAEQVHIHKEK